MYRYLGKTFSALVIAMLLINPADASRATVEACEKYPLIHAKSFAHSMLI